MRAPAPFRRKTQVHPVVGFTAGIAIGAVCAVAITEVMRRRRERDSRPRIMTNGDSPGPMTHATGKDHAADAHMGTPGRNLEERLDEALQESFPTSDPVSIQVG